jgi:SAM-dependent methyltransferase
MSSLDINHGNKPFLSLVETTALRYRGEGRYVHGFVRGKLLHDPVYREILYMSILPEQGKIVDLGCGRGILLALLTTMWRQSQTTSKQLVFQGFELRKKDTRIANQALGMDATIFNVDIRSGALPECQVVISIDVLMYMQKEEQETLLQEVFRVLQPNGILIIREADAGSGLPFLMTWLAERFCAFARGHWRQRYGYRSQQEWRGLLGQSGFSVETSPMSQGTPFANILFIARRGLM